MAVIRVIVLLHVGSKCTFQEGQKVLVIDKLFDGLITPLAATEDRPCLAPPPVN